MFEFDGSILLIHHWDTDGICSASLIMEKIRENKVKTWTPPLGTFFVGASAALSKM